MKFKGDGMRGRVLRAAGVLVVALVLAACGGGQQVQPFAPKRIIAFGDENSVIVDDHGDANGVKYTINYADATTARDCAKNPIWLQILATHFGLVFPQCNPTFAAATNRILAIPGATAGDVARQIDQFLISPDTFSPTDLVTILAGENDILAQYANIKAGLTTEAQATVVLQAAGTALAAQVNLVAQAGGKVLIATVQDMGVTPLAAADKLLNADAAAQLTRLTQAFNTKLRINLINDGHMIGLLLADEQAELLAKTGGWVPDTAACTTASALDCTALTLNTLPTGFTTWLWADATHLSASGHEQLGNLALGRAVGNPF